MKKAAGLGGPLNNMNFSEMVKSVNRLHAATAAESRRRHNAKLKKEAANRAAALKKKHLAEENNAVRALMIKISAAARNPTPTNVKKVQKALTAMQRPGSFRRGRFNVSNAHSSQ